MARLGDYVRIRTGKLDANASSENGQYPFFTCAVEPLRIDSYSYDCECVLVAGNGDLNVKYYNGKFDAYQRTYIIESLDETILSVPYLFCFLDKYVEKLRTLSIGGVIKYIKLGNLTEANIPLPNIQEQYTIVELCYKVNTLLSLRKQQLAKLDELVKARFIELFGTYAETMKLSDVATVSGGLTKNANRDKLPLRMPYLRVANVFFASVDVSEMLEIGLTEEEYKKTVLHYEDLLFVEGNGSPDQIGRVAIWRSEIEPCVHQNHLIKARFNKGQVIPTFAMYYFMSTMGREQIKAKAVSTSGLYTLSVSKISDLMLPVPPLELQNRFAALVEQTDKSKFAVQQSIEKLETLKKSLMQQYFG